jgi:two-component system cell cycle sensor histidine kinase/response regulator CckA
MSALPDIRPSESPDAALRESEIRLRQILDAAQEGIWTLGVDERTTFVNPVMAAMLGYTQAEMIGRPLSDFLDAEGLAVAEAALLALRQGPPGVIEGRMLRKNGETIWVSVNSSGLTDDTGAPNGALAVISDITMRRQAEDAMRLQSAALNASADAVVITNRAGTILWVNPAFEQLTGYSAGEAVGRNPRQVLKSGAHEASFYRRMWDTLLARQVWQGEITNRRKDGSRYIEDMTITPVLDARGEIDSFVAIKRDLTKKKELEAQLLQAQKMESIGRLAGGIAHDFNNLLTVINGISELGIDVLPEGDAHRRDLQEIKQAGERAAALTRQLLAFSRKQIVRPEVFDVNVVLAGAERMLRRMIGEDIQLVTKPMDSTLTVKADLGHLEQVLMNLVVNARDAMPVGGTLTIATRDVAVADGTLVHGGRLEPGHYAVLEVTDTGVGMDAAILPVVFDPFFTTKQPDKGTGLGLSTVYGIVQQWHGGISVSSTVGRGTTFAVYLPRAGDERSTAATADEVLSRGSETILVVEDEDAVRVMAERMLRSAGYEVLAVASGHLALQALTRPVALLITDVVMPSLSGPELVRRMSADGRDLPVLYMSGHSDNPALLREVTTAERRLISKPFSARQLTAMVRAALDQHATARSLKNLAGVDGTN